MDSYTENKEMLYMCVANDIGVMNGINYPLDLDTEVTLGQAKKQNKSEIVLDEERARKVYVMVKKWQQKASINTPFDDNDVDDFLDNLNSLGQKTTLEHIGDYFWKGQCKKTSRALKAA